MFADFYTFSDPARQWPKRTLITVFDSTWPDRPNRLEYQFFPPKSLKFSYDPSLSGAVQLQAGDIFKAESSADPGNSSDGMSWYKVTLITQNLTGGVTHYTSCYTAEITQITQKNTSFMAYLRHFMVENICFLTRFKNKCFF